MSSYRNTKTGLVQELPDELGSASPIHEKVESAPCVGCGLPVSEKRQREAEAKPVLDIEPFLKKGGED